MKKLTYSAATLLLCLLPRMEAMAGKSFAENQLKGSYAYSFQGEIYGGAPVAASGIINIHWSGHDSPYIKGLVVDAEGQRTISIDGSWSTNEFECDLTLNSNGIGSAYCVVVPPGDSEEVESFDFVAEDNGRGFRYVGTTLGVTAVGNGRAQ